MNHVPARVVTVALIVLAAAGCGSGPSTTVPLASQTPPPAASFDEYQTAFCDSFTSLVRGIGNPDTNTPSVLSKQLDDAVAAGNAASARQLAATITTELESGRRQAAVAAGWRPGARSATALDRVLLAFEAQVAAKAGGQDPQAAFERTGGVPAWTELLTTLGSVPVPTGALPKACKAFTGSI